MYESRAEHVDALLKLSGQSTQAKYEGIAKGSHLLETLQQLREAGLCVSICRKFSRDHPI